MRARVDDLDSTYTNESKTQRDPETLEYHKLRFLHADSTIADLLHVNTCNLLLYVSTSKPTPRKHKQTTPATPIPATPQS